MKKLTFYILSNLFLSMTFAQDIVYQYFDGEDTTALNSIIYEIDTINKSNIWQVGPPQKILFSTASTSPNVLITDTLLNLPTGDTSIVNFKVLNEWYNWGVLAIQWKQKLDYDYELDYGMVEFSTDGGTSWSNAFDNPLVYNFYGYNPSNVSYVDGINQAFTGQDTTWKDIWLCFDLSWLSTVPDTLRFRFVTVSDQIDNNNEGWMIDNMSAHFTWIHTINEVEADEYMRIQPNPTSGIINIATVKMQEYHVIEQIDVINESGAIVKKYGLSPTKFSIDLSDLPDGIYYLKIRTNIKEQEFKVVLSH